MTPKRARKRARRAMSRIVRGEKPSEARKAKLLDQWLRAICAKKRGLLSGAFTMPGHGPKWLRQLRRELKREPAI